MLCNDISWPKVEGMNRKAPSGTIYVCNACGKVAKWRWGVDDGGKQDVYASDGWDDSCATHAILCDEKTLLINRNGRVVSAISAED